VRWFRRLLVHGVFWRRLLRWGVLNTPLWMEPVMLATWSALFLFWGPGRRGVMRNLTGILPGSTSAANFFRTYRVFWNFANTIADNVRFKELRVSPDWEFEGYEHFERLQSQPGGGIILTAHMGSYDLGAQLFAEISDRKIVMVRAPEIDPETHRYEEELLGRTVGESLRVGFNTRASDLALELLEAVQRGDLVAIQGDRITKGIASLNGVLFGRDTPFPAGPFALAMAARVPIHPLFVVRVGRRRYRLIAAPSFDVARTRDRNEAFARALSQWTVVLEDVIRRAWYQWFMFQPFSQELP
jgi:predicted LPLAT superfamily acyltransferase